MGAGKLLVIGAVGVGLAALFLHSKDASASNSFPPGWTPPGTSKTTTVAAKDSPTGSAFTVTTWDVAADAGGTQAGTYYVLRSIANPTADFAVFFKSAASPAPAGIMAQGSTPMSGLIAQAAAAGLIE